MAKQIPLKAAVGLVKGFNDAFFCFLYFITFVNKANAQKKVKPLYLLYMYSKGADMLAIRLPNEINERLNDLAEKTGRTKSFYAREAILKHLEDLEDIYLAEKELEDVRAGKSKVYTAEEIGKKLGL